MRVFFVLIGVLFLGACAPQDRVVMDINALASPASPPPGGSVYVLPGRKGVRPTDLEFQEYAVWLGRGLQQAGYTLAANRDDADIILFLDYGISDQKSEEYTYQQPIYGQTGTSETTTSETTRNPDNSETTTSRTVTSPVYDVVGYEPRKGIRYFYDRFLDLWAFDRSAAPNFDASSIKWNIQVNSRGYSGDLRYIMGYMLAGSVPYMGRTSGKVVTVSLRLDEKSVKELRGER